MSKPSSPPVFQVLRCLVAAATIHLSLQMPVSPLEAHAEISFLSAAAQAVQQSWLPLLPLLALVGISLRLPIKGLRQRICLTAAAAFLTLCMLIGRAFIHPQWGNLVILADANAIAKWLACLPGWFLLWYLSLKALYAALDRLSECSRSRSAGQSMPNPACAHPFAAPFLILLLCYLPVIVLSMPGIVIPTDTVNQIMQFHGQRTPGIPWMYEDSTLTNHHPLLHTLLLNGFLEAGRMLFGSAQLGLGAFVCLQALLTICTLSLVLCELHREGVPMGLCLAAALFLGLHPRIQNLIVVVSKDIPYACALLLLGIGLLRIFHQRRHGWSLLIAACFAAMLTRNEGIYIVLLTLSAVCFMQKGMRLRAASVIGMSMIFWAIWTHVVFPAFHISPSSVREVLSIPFQQTARYVRSYEDSVTPQEREAIDAVLPFDRLSESYDINLSDKVKDLYRRDATNEELLQYLKAWARMFLKHPLTYVEAFLDNKDLFLYPSVPESGIVKTGFYYWVSEVDLQVISGNCGAYGISVSYPESLRAARNAYEQLREAIFSLPCLWLLTQCAPVVWCAVILFFYALQKKKRETLLLSIPLLLQILVVFVSPMDGNSFRYIFPAALYIPFLFLHAVCISPRRADSASPLGLSSPD